MFCAFKDKSAWQPTPDGYKTYERSPGGSADTGTNTGNLDQESSSSGEIQPDNKTIKCPPNGNFCYTYWEIDPLNKDKPNIVKQGGCRFFNFFVFLSVIGASARKLLFWAPGAPHNFWYGTHWPNSESLHIVMALTLQAKKGLWTIWTPKMGSQRDFCGTKMHGPLSGWNPELWFCD